MVGYFKVMVGEISVCVFIPRFFQDHSYYVGDECTFARAKSVVAVLLLTQHQGTHLATTQNEDTLSQENANLIKKQ